MFKFFVVMCVAASPMVAKQRELDPELQHILDGHDWLVATETAKMAMENCSTMANSPRGHVLDVYQIKLPTVINYANTTLRYTNRTYEIISRFTENYELAMKNDLVSYVDRIKNDVDELIRDAGEVDIRECERFANGLMNTTMHYVGSKVLAKAISCVAGYASEAYRLNHKINHEIFNGETERIETIWKRVVNCRTMSDVEVANCYHVAKRQIARGGVSFVNDVRENVGKMVSLWDNIRITHDKCKIDNGLSEYYEHLDDIVYNTINCINRKRVEDCYFADHESTRYKHCPS